MIHEKVIETKLCKCCNEKFEITDIDLEFYKKISPSFNGKKYIINTPLLCPECRMQRRFLGRNERSLYKRKCNLTGKDIISMYKPGGEYNIYNQEDWWSDKWDGNEYARDFDYDRGFFEQFSQLNKEVPKSALMNFNVENCDYTNFQNDAKGCYLTFGSGFMEDSMFTNWTYYGNNIVDTSFSMNVEYGYMLIDCNKIYNCFYCQNCSNSNNLYYCNDCEGSSFCFGSVGLRNKKYYYLNEKLDEEEYTKKVEKFFKLLGGEKKQILDKIKENKLKYPRKNLIISESENCTGDYISNSKNCHNCFDLQEGEDSKYCTDVLKIKNHYDTSKTGLSELIYEVCGGGYYNNVGFSYVSASLSNCYYMIECNSCKNCFGCVGLKNKEYCILNKQYSREEYERLVPKIIEHMMKNSEWGEFFPSNISPFGYNETVAMENFPLTKKEALEKGFNWSDYESPLPKVEKIIRANKLPDNIRDIPDDILNWAVECEVTKKPFKIVRSELKFYRKHDLTIPKKHPDQRHIERINKRNKRKLFDKKCDKCQTNIKTTFSEDREGIVYCRKCYDKEVY